MEQNNNQIGAHLFHGKGGGIVALRDSDLISISSYDDYGFVSRFLLSEKETETENRNWIEYSKFVILQSDEVPNKVSGYIKQSEWDAYLKAVEKGIKEAKPVEINNAYLLQFAKEAKDGDEVVAKYIDDSGLFKYKVKWTITLSSSSSVTTNYYPPWAKINYNFALPLKDGFANIQNVIGVNGTVPLPLDKEVIKMDARTVLYDDAIPVYVDSEGFKQKLLDFYKGHVDLISDHGNGPRALAELIIACQKSSVKLFETLTQSGALTYVPPKLEFETRLNFLWETAQINNTNYLYFKLLHTRNLLLNYRESIDQLLSATNAPASFWAQSQVKKINLLAIVKAFNQEILKYIHYEDKLKALDVIMSFKITGDNWTKYLKTPFVALVYPGGEEEAILKLIASMHDAASPILEKVKMDNPDTIKDYTEDWQSYSSSQQERDNCTNFLLGLLKKPEMFYRSTSKSRFRILYEGYNDGLFSDNFSLFTSMVYKIWEQSDFNPYYPHLHDYSILDEAINPGFTTNVNVVSNLGLTIKNIPLTETMYNGSYNGENIEYHKHPMIAYESKYEYGFYFDDYNFNFTEDGDIQQYMDDAISSIPSNNASAGVNALAAFIVNSFIDGPKVGEAYSPFHPITPVGLDPSGADIAFKVPMLKASAYQNAQMSTGTVVNYVCMPYFLLKAMDDAGDNEDLWTFAEYTLDTISLLTGVGGVVRLAAMRATTILGRAAYIGVSGTNMAASVYTFKFIGSVLAIPGALGNLGIKVFINNCGSKFTKDNGCQKLKSFFMLLELASLAAEGTAFFSSLRKSAKEIKNAFPDINETSHPNHQNSFELKNDTQFETPNVNGVTQNGYDVLIPIINKFDPSIVDEASSIKAFFEVDMGMPQLSAQLENLITVPAKQDFVREFVRVFRDADKVIKRKELLVALEGNLDLLDIIESLIKHKISVASYSDIKLIKGLADDISLYPVIKTQMDLSKEFTDAYVAIKKISNDKLENIDKFYETLEPSIRTQISAAIRVVADNVPELGRMQRGRFWEAFTMKDLAALNNPLSHPAALQLIQNLKTTKQLSMSHIDLSKFDMFYNLRLNIVGVANTAKGGKAYFIPDICFISYKQLPDLRIVPDQIITWDVKLNSFSNVTDAQKLQMGKKLVIASDDISDGYNGLDKAQRIISKNDLDIDKIKEMAKIGDIIDNPYPFLITGDGKVLASDWVNVTVADDLISVSVSKKEPTFSYLAIKR